MPPFFKFYHFLYYSMEAKAKNTFFTARCLLDWIRACPLNLWRSHFLLFLIFNVFFLLLFEYQRELILSTLLCACHFRGQTSRLLLVLSTFNYSRFLHATITRKIPIWNRRQPHRSVQRCRWRLAVALCLILVVIASTAARLQTTNCYYYICHITYTGNLCCSRNL